MLIAGMGYSQVKVVSSGKVKIGDTNTAPTTELHLTGDLLVEPKVGIIGGLRGNATTQRFAVWNGGINVQNPASYCNFNGTGQGGAMVFNGGRVNFRSGKAVGDFGDLAMEITSAGDVGIGTLTPMWTLHVDGTAGKTGGGEFATVSDKRLKKNINKYKLGLDEVLRINPVTFLYDKIGGLDTDETYVGVLAQEFQEVDPMSVKPIMLEEKEEYIGDDGHGGSVVMTKTNSKQEYLSVDGSSIKYMLVNAIKEQQLMIENLQKQIIDLKDIVRDNDSMGGINIENHELFAGDKAEIAQNRPNPFGEFTVIDYYLPESVISGQINFVGQNGSLISTKKLTKVGNGTVQIATQELPSGVYSYQLIADGKLISTKKMVKTK